MKTKHLFLILLLPLIAVQCKKESTNCCDIQTRPSLGLALVDLDTNNLLKFPTDSKFHIDSVKLLDVDSSLFYLVKLKDRPQDSTTFIYLRATEKGGESLPAVIPISFSSFRPTDTIHIIGPTNDLTVFINKQLAQRCVNCPEFAYQAYLFFEP